METHSVLRMDEERLVKRVYEAKESRKKKGQKNVLGSGKRYSDWQGIASSVQNYIDRYQLLNNCIAPKS